MALNWEYAVSDHSLKERGVLNIKKSKFPYFMEEFAPVLALFKYSWRNAAQKLYNSRKYTIKIFLKDYQ